MHLPMSVTDASAPAGPFAFFFFGTLMHPSVLIRVLGHSCESLTFQSAVLPSYVRHHLIGLDYPCIITRAESERITGGVPAYGEDDPCVRGTLVKGLTLREVMLLDVFEGDEYDRSELEVYTLTHPVSIEHELRTIANSLNSSGITLAEVRQHLAAGRADYARASAWVYLFKPSLLHNVSPDIWEFASFMKEKAHRWAGTPTNGAGSEQGVDEDQYADVDQVRGLTLEDTPVTASTTMGSGGGSGALASGEVGWGGALTARDVQAASKSSTNVRQHQAGPDFGHGLLKYWQFDPKFTNLNHGSFGSPPIPVIEKIHALSRQCESNPDLFMRKSYLPLLNGLRKRLADLVHADVEDCVLVGNATVAVGTVLWNLDWQEGDVILGYSTTYNACAQSCKYVCDKNPGVMYEQIPLEFEVKPGEMYNSTLTHKEILRRTEEWLRRFNGLDGMLIKGKRPRVRMVLMDAISSNPGLVMPWPGIVKLCKEYGALSLVDAAHEIGHLPIDLKASQPDFWLSNCHKWLFGHRGCCLFYVNKDAQHLIRTSMPTSHFYESEAYPSVKAKPIASSAFGGLGPFAEQWEWVGTQDWTPFLSVDAALDFREFLGGEKRIMRQLHALALAGGKAAAKILGTSIMENDDEELTGCMVNLLVEPIDTQDKTILGQQLRWWTNAQFEQDVFTAVYVFNNAWWTRMSAQVWLEVADFAKGAEALVRLRQSFRSGSWKQDLAVGATPSVPESPNEAQA